MGVTANVQSVEALKDFRVALCRFVEAARSSVGEADADVQRHIFWLNEDRRRHWKEELRKREEKLRQAKMALLTKKLEKTATGGRASCVDEEKAVALAVRRFEEAQLKSANTVRWSRKLDEQIFEFKGMLQAFNHALDVDVVNGLAWLDRMIESLEAYLALAPPIDLPPIEESSTADGDFSRANPIIAEADETATESADTESQDSPATDASDEPDAGAPATDDHTHSTARTIVPADQEPAS